MSFPISSHCDSIYGCSGTLPEQPTEFDEEKRWDCRKVRKNIPSKNSKIKPPAVRGKNFSDMSITERFVFVLSLLSGLQCVSAQSSRKSDICSVATPTNSELNTCPKAGFSDWVATLEKTGRKDDSLAEYLADKCSASKVTTRKKRSAPKRKSQPQSCLKPDLMEQIGPVGRMTGVYKKSDETSIVLGIKNPETVHVMKKYKDLVSLEFKTLQLKKILEQINQYITQNNNDFGMLSYDEKEHVVKNMYYTFPLTTCVKGLFDELDSYDTALKEIFMYQKELGDYKAYAKELDGLIKGRNVVLSRLLKSLKNDLNTLKRYTSAALKFNSDSKGSNFKKHKKYIDSQFKKLEAVISPAEIKRLFQQCLKNQKKCHDEKKQAEAKEIAERVRARREANKKSLGMKLLNLFSVTYLVSLMSLIGSSLVIIPLPRKITRYFASRKKIDTSPNIS
ncbi:hypothetical protein GZ77_16670 [Endozoicomonas montiporae]|uniref:Uncharacterized protein n=2 Tax=Endozoicomonas montiporae TaxID=1027273 RepID=A0A081N613_9GAMM|nr:hypothetical protein [Endozoicomonas montiporae]AMO57195.1 hypothetical protein EZMO1_3191 [Endozoicomonas montiporae CL-33]KEQ13886.1 hypothetical protein GZ77_16670 [Endozoicomonas montiporae]